MLPFSSVSTIGFEQVNGLGWFFNLLKTNVRLIEPINKFPAQINWLVSVKVEHSFQMN